METLQLTQEWDKTFPQSEKVDHRKVVFHNRFGITLAGDLYKPKDDQDKLSAIAVAGPFGAVKKSFWFICPNNGQKRFCHAGF